MAVFELIMVIKNCKGQGQIVHDNLENLHLCSSIYIFLYNYIYMYYMQAGFGQFNSTTYCFNKVNYVLQYIGYVSI